MTEHNRVESFSQTGSQNTGSMANSVKHAAGDAANTAASRVKETAASVTEQAKQTAGTVAEQAKQTLDEATRQTKSEVANVTDQVRQQADSLISDQKNMAAERLGTLAGTLRESGRQLQGQDEAAMGRYADIIADQVESVSNFLRDRNTGDLLNDVQRLARQQPELFVAGSLAVGFLIGRFIKGPSRSALRQEDYNPNYYGQGGYQSGYQSSAYQSGNYQGGAYQSGGYQPGGFQSGYQSGGYGGSDSPAEGADSRRQTQRRGMDEYEGRYESSGFQGNAFQQGGQESIGYQAEGADPDAEGTHGAGNYTESYEGGNSAYETGPTITEGSDTDYPRFDPSYSGGKSGSESGSESGNYSPSSRR